MAEKEIMWSRDGETFNYDSLEELIDAERHDLEVGSVVEFGTKVEHITSAFVPDADQVMDQMADRAYDVGGEFAEDFPDVTAEAKKELDDFLSAWAEKHVTVTFWTITGTQKYTITEDDLKAGEVEGG